MPPNVVIRTLRLIIRPWSLKDAEQLVIAANFRSISRMTAALPHPYKLSDARYWIPRTRRQLRQRPLQHMHLAITHRGVVIGAIGVDRHGDQAEFGYWLTPTMWGQGIMTEAIGSFVPFVFHTWPIQRMIAKTFLFNPASARVLEKSGFQKTAVEYHTLQKKGRWLDTNVFTRYRV